MKMKRTGIILIVAMALGLGYGCLSAMLNQNPYYSIPPDENLPEDRMFKAWDWQPSPVWLPSYLLCKVPRNGYGISHTRSGYLFRSEAKRKNYFVASTILGAILCAIAAGVVIAVTRRKKSV